MIDPNSFFHIENRGWGKKWSLPKKQRDLESVNEGEDKEEELSYSVDFRHFLPLYILAFVVFAVLGFKLYSLQILTGDEYRKKADTHSLREEVIKAPRGVIYDRNRKTLAGNIPSFQVVIIPSDLPSDEGKKSETLQDLARVLNMKVDTINKILEENKEHPFEQILIKENIDYNTALIVESKFDQFSGVTLKKDPARQYKEGIYFSNIIGYVSRINKEEYKENKSRGYLINDLIGKTGIESFYEKTLRGKNGKQILEVDASNRIIRHLGSASEPVSGQSLILSVDSGLQKKAYDALRRGTAAAGCRKASAVAINPNTGEVLALVSLPSFDNNLFAKGISTKEYLSLANDPAQPLFNRAVSGTYPTGSSIKPVVASAALQEGVINSGTQINDPGAIIVHNQYNPKITYRFSCWDLAGHGYLSIREAIAHSCNVFFYTVSGGYKNFVGLGAEKLAKYMKYFGLGAVSGIDLPNEASGLVPTPEWKEKTKKESWYIGDTYLLSIGQTNLLATPLQVCNYTATIANGGTLYKPKVVREVLDSQGRIISDFEPELIRTNFVSKTNIDLVRQGMRQAVTSGTAMMLKSLPVPVCGKTGTAQFGVRNEKSHAWFTCFGPYKNPKIALTVMVEGGGEGSTIAVPIAKEILQYYFTRK